MASYFVKIRVDGTNINTVKKTMEVHFPGFVSEIEKINLNQSRSDRLSDAELSVDDARCIVEELKEEMEAWKDSIPENLQGGDKYIQIEECISALEEIQSNLENFDFGSVDFPSMMG
jgi:hypothetical protein